jgi:hypothetical protein
MTDELAMLVATHKQAEMPSDPLYVPLHVGAAGSSAELGYQRDDDGENISEKNASYCELTGLYWAWKNLDADVIGLSHYRRYFVGTAVGPDGSRVMSSEEARDALREHDVVLSKPRNYYVETIDSHYRHAHVGSDLDALREVVASRHPEHLAAFDAVMSGRRLSLYNMFLMRRELFDEYGEWLFGILEEVEGRIDNSGRSVYQQRTYGYLGERLLNIWIRAQGDRLQVATHKVVNTHGEPKLRKGVEMVKRKLSRG